MSREELLALEMQKAIAAIEEPNVSLCTWEVAGPWWMARARKLERLISASLRARAAEGEGA